MKELELKYGCNPNQKPSRIFMNEDKELPITVLSGSRIVIGKGISVAAVRISVVAL